MAKRKTEKTSEPITMQPSARIAAAKGKPARYSVRFYPIDMVTAARYPDGAEAERLAEQNRIRVRLAEIDAHPHRDPKPSPMAHWRRPVTEGEMAKATIAAALYRVELSADELAEAEAEEHRAAARAAQLVASAEPVEAGIADRPDCAIVMALPLGFRAELRYEAPKRATNAPTHADASAPTDSTDRARRLSEAARKAWATRRARAA